MKSGKVTTACMHHGFLMNIRNNWGLWSGSDLREWFFDRRIMHADDMSSVIMDSYIAKLKGKDFNISAAQRKYEKHWKKAGLDIDKEIKRIRSGE